MEVAGPLGTPLGLAVKVWGWPLGLSSRESEMSEGSLGFLTHVYEKY